MLPRQVLRLAKNALLVCLVLAPLESTVEATALSSSTAQMMDRSCRGVRVRDGANLRSVMGSHPPGTTYCLAAATYRIVSPIAVDRGDRVIGSGRDKTFIDGSGLPETAEGIFLTNTNAFFARFDIFGAPTPAAGSGVYCNDASNCGKAFSLRGSNLGIRHVDCHDNGGNCIGGGGSTGVTVHDLDCWNNGNAYSMTPSFLYAACIKRAAVYDMPGSTTVTNSYIHNNAWAGIWCDHCKHGLFYIENSRFVDNGLTGIEWEMSGGWTSDDRAVIKNNTFRGNNTLSASYSAGMHVSTANDITIKENTFRGNVVAGVSVIFAASRNPPQPNSRGVDVKDNAMHGDLIQGCDLPGVYCGNNQ